MRFLLDTHSALWWLADDARLGLRARAIIENPDTEVLVSIVSLWEIAVKIRAGKLQADLGEVWEGILASGFTLLGIEIAHLLEVIGLPTPHRDPFDHLLIAQANVERAVFLSEDVHVPSYPVRHLTCSDSPGSAPDAR